MSDNNYHIKLNFCQLTLDELRNPYIHVDKGCQFNQLENQFQLAFCPVCKDDKKNEKESKQKIEQKIQQDDNLIIQIEQKNERQIVYEKTTKAHYFMKRRNFTQDNISQIKEVKDLQKNFYQNLRQKNITLKHIQEISQIRNQYYISCLKNLSDSQKIPILMAVINNKLILFYHLYKLKVELTLLDVTTPKIRQKIGNNTHGVLQQIMLFENNIYFLYLKLNVSTLFIGDFQQIFTLQNNQEAQFQIKSIAMLKLEGPSRLIQIGDKQPTILMLGNKSYSSLTQQNNVFKPHPLESLTANTLCHHFNNNQILMVNSEEDKVNNKINLIYFCYDLLKPNFAQDPKNIQETFPQNQKFDNYLTFGDQMVLFCTSDLRNEKCSIRSISSWLPNTQRATPILQTISVTNHQSYMLPIKIISTSKSMNNITCQLIGIRLPKKDLQQPEDESDVFPALLVYNGQTQSFEVELI